MGIFTPLLLTLGASGATAGGAATAAGITAAGVGAGAGSLLSGATTASTLLGAASNAAMAFKKPPPTPSVPTPPTPPSFASNLSSGNQSLAAQSPLAALGGTSTGNFNSPSAGGGKTLLGS